MRRLAKIAGALLLVLVVGAGGLAAWGWYELRANGARIREAYASGLARVRPAFMEDQELACTHPILAPAGRASDAGPTMNPRIGWDGDPQRMAQWLTRLPGRPPPLVLDQALAARIPKEWWATPPGVWKGLDFSWLAALTPFDHWDVESNSPWADAAATSGSEAASPFWSDAGWSARGAAARGQAAIGGLECASGREAAIGSAEFSAREARAHRV